MTKLFHICSICLKMKKISTNNMSKICEKCLENNHCKDTIKCDCSICNDNF